MANRHQRRVRKPCNVARRGSRREFPCRRRPSRIASTHSRSEQAVRGVPGPDAIQDLGIVGNRRVTEAQIKMAVVGRLEDGVEASIEKEWDGEVLEAMVPLIGCFDASGLRDAGSGHPVNVDGVEQDTAGSV